MDVKTALDFMIGRLRACSDTPELDAQVLLAHSLSKPRSWLPAHPEMRLDPETTNDIGILLERLERGEPLPYVIGQWEFFGLSFEVTPDVLIPRPETELLVECALGWLRRWPEKRGLLDVGTGSGCIGISLAVNIHDLRVTATDISPAALAVARRNAQKLGVAKQITCLQADLLPKLQSPDPYSLIVANLPYIPSDTLHHLPAYGREPTLALDGGADGLTLIRRLIKNAPPVLAPGGMILMEIEASEGSMALSIASDTFRDAKIHLQQDLAGLDRLLVMET